MHILPQPELSGFVGNPIDVEVSSLVLLVLHDSSLDCCMQKLPERASADGPEVLLETPGGRLTQAEIDRLGDGKWYNDEVQAFACVISQGTDYNRAFMQLINVYLSFLVQEDPTVFAFSTGLFTQLQRCRSSGHTFSSVARWKGKEVHIMLCRCHLVSHTTGHFCSPSHSHPCQLGSQPLGSDGGPSR